MKNDLSRHDENRIESQSELGFESGSGLRQFEANRQPIAKLLDGLKSSKSCHDVRVQVGRALSKPIDLLAVVVARRRQQLVATPRSKYPVKSKSSQLSGQGWLA